MPATVQHVFSCGVADGTNTQVVRPSDWNSAHAITLNVSGTDIIGAFSNSNGISFGTEAGGGVTASYTVPSVAGFLTTARASNDGVGLNTAQSNVTWTVNSSGLSLDARGYAGTVTGATNASVTANSNGVSVSVTQSNQAVSAANGSYAFQTLSFSNANGVSFGTSAGSAITASHNGLTTARASNDGIGLNTALTAGPLAWTVNSSGLSLNASSVAGTTSGFSGNSISGSMTHNTAGLALSLNHPAWLTTAAQSDHSHGNPTLNLTNLSGTTASNSAGFTLSLSAAAGGGGADGVNILAAGTQTANTTGTVLFNNGNGITFGMSNSSVITASHNGLTTARASNDAIGLNTAQSNVTWTVNSSGLSLDARGYAGTATAITGNASITLNSGGLSFNGSNLAGVGTTFNGAGISGSMTVNSAGVQLSASVTQSNQAFSAAGGSSAFQTLTFADTNGVSWTNTNGSVGATVRTDYASSIHGHTITAFATSNTTQSSTGTINMNSLIFAGAGIASVGVTNGSVVVSVPSGGGAGDGVNILAAGTQTANTTGTVAFSNSNGVSFGMSNSSVITASVGNTRTWSGMVIAPFAGYGGPLHFAQSSFSLGQNSLYIYPVQVEDNLTVDHIRLPVMVSHSSSGAASIQKGYTYQLGIYTRNATNNTVLTRHYSTSYTLAASHNSNVSWMVSMITAIGNSTSYNTLTASSAGVNLSASLHGPREFIMPVSSLLTPGEYWFAVVASTSSVGGAGSILQLSNLGVAHQTFNRPGLSTASSNSGWLQFMGAGIYSTTTGAIPGGISATQINQAGSLPIMFAATGTV